MNPFERFCENYRKHFTYNGQRPRQFGVEKEILVADERGRMADVTKTLWPHLSRQGLTPLYDNVYTEERVGFETSDGTITTDAGKGTLEIILEPLDTAHECNDRMDRILKRLLPLAEEERLNILGVAYQPVTVESIDNWIRKQRYEALIGTFGENVFPFTLGAADQVHVDVSEEEFVPVLNLMTGLAGFMIVLFSNTPLRHGKKSEPQAYREGVWDGLGKDRTGIPDRPWTSLEEYLQAAWELSCIMVKESGRYRDPQMSFREYAEGKSDEQIMNAFMLHEGTVWFCTRPRIFGTLEIRPAGLQPWGDRMSLPVFIMGLIENWKAVQDFMNQYEWDTLKALRYRAMNEGFSIEINGEPIAEPLLRLIQLSEEGLIQRGQGEEIYLKSLYARVEDQKSPADVALDYFKAGGLSLLLEKTSLRSEHLSSIHVPEPCAAASLHP